MRDIDAAARAPFDYDLVILGGAYTGSVTALVARAQGLSVLLVDKSDLPRFSVGESTAPDQCRRLEILSRRYAIPILASIASYPRIVNEGLPVAAWPKCAFYLVHHELDRPLDPRAPAETLIQTSPWPTGPEPHVMREDLDLLLKDHAVAAGAVWSPHTQPVELEFRERDGAPSLLLRRKDGSTFRATARLVVDASGVDSWMAKRMALRAPDSLDTPMRSSSVFLQMKNMGSWDAALAGAPTLPLSRDYTTIQHLFDGGSVWQIPFDDGRVSIGVTQSTPFDESLSPEQMFRRAMDRLPTLAATLADAEPVTPYFYWPDFHYGSKRIYGDGWFLMPTAAESSDPFLAAGLGISTAAVCRLACVLEKAPRNDVVRADLLAPLEPQFRTESSYVRRMILACRRAFADPELFQRTFFLYRIAAASDGFALADATLESTTATVWGFGDPALRNLVDTVRAEVEALPRGRRATPDELARLDAIIADNEPWPFSRTRFGALRDDKIYLASLVRVLDFVLKTRGVHRGERRRGAMPSVVGRWTRGLLKAPRIRSSASRPYPADGVMLDQLRMIFSR